MRSPQTLKRILAADSALATWNARRQHECALTDVVRSRLPRQLAARIRVADAQKATLEIVADSGAVAAAVRQRLPAVLAELQRDGHEFNAISVRVQVRIETGPVPKPTRNPIDGTSLASLARLTDGLETGPLRTSLLRLLKRTR